MSLGEKQFTILFDKATNPSLKEPDWDSILKLSDLINEKRVEPVYIFASIADKLKTQNRTECTLCLQVLEAIIKNSGSHDIYSGLSSTYFMTDLRQFYIECDDEFLLRKVKTLLATWALTFRNLPSYKNIQDTVTSMKSDGVIFPIIKEEDASLLLNKAPAWVNSSTCAKCYTTLGWFRTHHCRHCGQAFCYNCSSKYAKLPQFGLDGNVRVCDGCFEKVVNGRQGTALDALKQMLDTIQQDQADEEIQMAIALSLSEAGDVAQENVSKGNDSDSDSDLDSDLDSDDQQSDPPGLDIVDDDDLVTLDDFRLMCYKRDRNTENILVRRSHLVEDILKYYKNPGANLYRRPYIIFEGEDGLDGGALTKEFFFSGIYALASASINGLPIFEGDDNHRLPSRDINLLLDGTFQAIGRFMMHSTIHMGIAFIGLSKTAAAYILHSDKDDNSSDIDSGTGPRSQFPITLDDVPDHEIRSVIKIAQRIQTDDPKDPISIEELSELRSAAINVGFNSRISAQNAPDLIQILLYDHTIELRRRQVDSLKKAWGSSPLLKFLQKRGYLWDSVFPREEDLSVPASVVLGLIEFEGDDDDEDESKDKYKELVDDFKEFVVKLGNGEVDSADIPHLVECWTGSRNLRGGETLVLKVKDIPYIRVQACTNEIYLPKGVTKDELFKQLTVAVIYGSKGFGNENENMETIFENVQLFGVLLRDMMNSVG